MEKLVFPAPLGLLYAYRYTTVRPGSEWWDKVNLNDEIELCGPDGDAVAIGQVVDKWKGPVIQVPAALLEVSHNTLHRTFTGLIMSMSAALQRQATPNDIITILTLMPLRESRIHIAKEIPNVPTPKGSD